MNIISPITGRLSYSNSAVQTEPRRTPSQPPAQLPRTQGQGIEDTVHLSQAAQIQQLVQQGASPSTIASATGLSVIEVRSDLGVSSASNTATPAPRLSVVA